MLHNFEESLALSNSYADAEFWTDVYREAFPTLRSCVCVRQDGWAQRAGIDRVLTLECGRTIPVDEKAREKVWPDILLEDWSDFERKKPGWVQKPLLCEFINYAFVPSKTAYLLPTQTLQRAWRLNGSAWTETYGHRAAKNNGYTTTSVPVPIDVLMRALSGAMKITVGDA